MEEERSPRFIIMSKSNEKNPVESHAYRGFNLCKSHGGGKNERDRQNFVISKVPRKDLEDRFYSAIEKNLALKQLLNKKDEKLKLLGTKLYRLTQQLKKESAVPDHYQPLGKTLEEQSIRIVQLQCEKKVLCEKVNVLKRQISAQKNLISTAKSYKPKRLGSLERHRISGNVKSDDTKREQQEDNDYFILLEEHPDSSVHDDGEKSEKNDDDEKFKSDNGIQKNIPNESKASETSEQSGNSCNKFNEASTSRVSFFSKLKSVKSKLPAKDIQVQTSLENVSKTTNEDIVSEQLAQEHMLVLDLQQQLKSAQLTQRVVDEVEQLVKVLSNKNILKEERKVSTDSSFGQKEPSSIVILRQELQKEKIDLQAQKKMNEQLMSKLSEMQKELDNLNIKFKRASSTPKNFGHKFSPPISPKHNAISEKSVTPSNNTNENFIRNMNGTTNKNTNENFNKSTNGTTNKSTNDISNKTTNENFNSFASGIANKSTNYISNKNTYMSNQNTKDSSVKIVKNVNNSPRKSGKIASGISSKSDKTSGEESDKSDILNKSQKHANNASSKSEQNSNNVSVKNDKNIAQDFKSETASMKSPPPSRTRDPTDNTIKQERLPQNNKRVSSPTTTSQNDSIIKRELSRMTEESNNASKAKQSNILSTDSEKKSQPLVEFSNKASKSGVSSRNEGWGSEEIIWSTATLEEIKENEESFDDATYDISKTTTFSNGGSRSSSPRHTDSTNGDLLSDGEVPKKKSRRSIKYSQEMNTTQESLIIKSEPLKFQGPLDEEEKTSPETVSEKVEITLKAISKELNRCSELLCSKDHKECDCVDNKKSAGKLIGQSKSSTIVHSDATNEDLSEGEIPKCNSLGSIKSDQEMKSKSRDISTITEENNDKGTNSVLLVTEVRSKVAQSEQILISSPIDITNGVKCNEGGCAKDLQVCDCAEHEFTEVSTDSLPSSQHKLNGNTDSSKLIDECKTSSLVEFDDFPRQIILKSLGSIYSGWRSKNSVDETSLNRGVIQQDAKLSPLVTDGNKSLVLVKVKLHTPKESPKMQGCDNQGCPKDDKECVCADDEANHYSPHRSQHKLSDKSQSAIIILEKKSSKENISMTKEGRISKDTALPPCDGSRETIRVEVELEAIHGMETAPAYKEPAKKMNCEEEGCTKGCEVCTCDNTKVSSPNELSQSSRQDVDSVKPLLSPDLPEA